MPQDHSHRPLVSQDPDVNTDKCSAHVVHGTCLITSVHSSSLFSSSYPVEKFVHRTTLLKKFFTGSFDQYCFRHSVEKRPHIYKMRASIILNNAI